MKTKSIGITKRQQDTLNFMKQFKEEKGYMPTIREICKGINVTSPGTAHSHLKKLINKGYIEFNGGNRTYRIIEEPRNIEVCGSLFTKSEYDELAKSNEDKKIAKLIGDWQNVFNEKIQQDFVEIILNKINEIIDKVNGDN